MDQVSEISWRRAAGLSALWWAPYAVGWLVVGFAPPAGLDDFLERHDGPLLATLIAWGPPLALLILAGSLHRSWKVPTLMVGMAILASFAYVASLILIIFFWPGHPG